MADSGNTPLSYQEANVMMHDNSQDLNMDSPNAMALVTDDTHIIQPNGVLEKDSIAEIIPDALGSDADQLPDLPQANDCMSFATVGWLAVSGGSLLIRVDQTRASKS